MKKKRGILFKISLIAGILLVFATVFSIALLEPGVKIFGWERLDESLLIRSEKSVTFLDANDARIANAVYDANISYASFSDIPEHTIDAFVSIEDKRFFKHKGVDYIRIGGALIDNIKSFSFKEGASTISQQLIKNTHLTSNKTISRKIKEIRIARELERRFSKSEILEMYLNMLYFGDNIYGITSSAEVFFGVKPQELTLTQSALLAGIINNPARYSPYRNSDNALERRNFVLKEMLENKKIDKETYDEAIQEPLGVKKESQTVGQYLNSVILDACEKLKLNKKQLWTQKLTIATYYDSTLDDKLLAMITKSDIPNGSNAHVVVLKNADGSLIADVGLKDDNLAYLKRQPGSTIKPLIAYAPALETGEIYCCSHILDEPTDFGGYSPSNYRNKYYGWVTAEEALSRSLNIPAVKLLERVGVDYGKSIAEKMGISFSESDTNLALALGGMTDGVTLRELSNAYRVFACGGNYIRGSAIRYIADENGNILYSDNRSESRAISEDTAFLISTMLKKCATEGTAKKLARFDNVCAKTGTVGNADGNTDIYCMAYSPTFTVGVWIGGNRMNNNITASSTACALAEKVFGYLNDDSAFERPEGIKCRYIDTNKLKEEHAVMLAGEDVCLKDKTCEWFSESYMPTEYSTPQGGGYFYYDDLLNLDFDNFEIVESFFD